jgi:tRNA (guanine-N7-)-methyltransferase
VIRGGRLTPGQERAIDRLWSDYGIDAPEGSGHLDYEILFGRKAPVIAEIGFGNGEATWKTALAHPDQDFIGIEVHQPGVGRLLMALEEHGLTNVRIACEDAVAFMDEHIAPASLDGIRIYFPDPWPKKRHHKRRIVQPDFLARLATCMKPGAILHLATDWAPYAEHMTEVLSASAQFRNLAEKGHYCPKPGWRPETHFERRGRRLGHEVFDLLYERLN